MFKKICIIAISCCIAGSFAGFSFADSFAKTTIPVKYEVTNGATVDSTFTLKGEGSIYTQGYAPMPEGSDGNVKTIKMTTGGDVDFGEIAFTSPDVYKYSIKKETKDLPGMTKDESEYIAYVMVTNDGQVSTVINKEGTEEKPDEILFADSVVITETSCKDNPSVLKTVQGKKNSHDSFSFDLIAVTKDAPMPEGSNDGKKTITAIDGKTQNFGSITFSKEGEFDYQVSEVNTGLKGYTYDTTVYDVKYSVTKEGNKLLCQRTVTANGKKMSIANFGFTNVYKPATPSETISDDPTDTGGGSITKDNKHSRIYENTIGKVIKTGDSENPLIMMATMLIALLGLTVFAIIRRKEKKQEKAES